MKYNYFCLCYMYVLYILWLHVIWVPVVMANCTGRRILRWICGVQLPKPSLPWICFATTDLPSLKVFIKKGINISKL